MTDLRKHLKGIHKIIHSTHNKDTLVDVDKLRSELRAYLPSSYGIASGYIKDGEQQSKPVQLLLYDVPLSANQYTTQSQVFDVQHVLAVLDIAQIHSENSMIEALERIASVKCLETGRTRNSDSIKPEQTRLTIPKDRLPFCLLIFSDFEESFLSNTSAIDYLHHFMQNHTIEYLPDELEWLNQRIYYRNPLLSYHDAKSYDIGLSIKPHLHKPRNCYTCKQKFIRQHFFYEQMCTRCSDLNYTKRKQSADLFGWRALVTGARVKIGYFTALKLLRAGAEVIVTSRFPRDAASRYTKEPDFEQWQDRLHIYGLDLRQIPRVEEFIQHLYENYSHLDILINNAAQTVKRPPAYYAHLIPLETQPVLDIPTSMRNLLHGELADTSHLQPALGELLLNGNHHEPVDEFDEFGQAVDNRDYNSWVMRLDEVPTTELLEVQLVNAIAPAIFAAQLKQLMCNSPREKRHIINVSAAEGRFTQSKGGLHPHTNMAKAALNMLTRTIAQDYIQDNIYVNSIDPGWVSDQLPRTNNEVRAIANENLPLDMEDAAARICDLFFSEMNIPQGKLLKDYAVVSW